MRMLKQTWNASALTLFGLCGCAAHTAGGGSEAMDKAIARFEAHEQNAKASAAAPRQASFFVERSSAFEETESDDDSAGRKRHVENRHHINFSAGIDDETSEKGGYRVGIDYEYHFAELWGAGVIFDRTMGRIDESLLAVQFIAHPFTHLGLVAAPGYNFRLGAADSFAFRVGAFYEFELGAHLALTPAIYYDFLENGVRSTIVTVGLGIGF